MNNKVRNEVVQDETVRSNIIPIEKIEKNDEMEIDLLELFHALLHRLWLIVICFLAGAVIAGGYTKLFITPQYSASSMIYILSKSTSVTSLADIQLGTQLTPDYEMMVKSRPVVEAVIEKMNLDMSYGQLSSMISTENPTGTHILKLTVTNPEPKKAKEIANAFADVTADQVAEIMNTEKPSIYERAVTPGSPSSPNLMRNTALGALVGAFLAIAVVVILQLMNDTIQTEEDVRKYLGLHTLAAMPIEKRR